MSFLLKATAVEGPQYAPNKIHTVEIICPGKVPDTYICKTKEDQFISIHKQNLLLLWEPPTVYEKYLSEEISKENEQIQREHISNTNRWNNPMPCPLNDPDD